VSADALAYLGTRPGGLVAGRRHDVWWGVPADGVRPLILSGPFLAGGRQQSRRELAAVHRMVFGLAAW